MNLHNQIMNIQINEKNIWHKYGTDGTYAYKEGHRDARHAAAELSLKAEAKIEELESQIKELQQRVSDYGWAETESRHNYQQNNEGWK